MIKPNSRTLTHFFHRMSFLPWTAASASEPERTYAESLPAAAAAPGQRRLSRLTPGEREVVCRVADGGPIRQRLLELGVTPGALVEVIRFAPLGDPMEVRVRGYHLSLRRREADAIWVGAPREAGSEECGRDGFDTPGAAPRGAGRKSQ